MASGPMSLTYISACEWYEKWILCLSKEKKVTVDPAMSSHICVMDLGFKTSLHEEWFLKGPFSEM